MRSAHRILLAAMWVALSCGMAHGAEERAVAVYVAPNGDDGGSGAADRPVATLQKAVALARAAGADRAKRIILRGGRYYDVSVELTPEDSNLSIEGAAGEGAELIGGVLLGGWEKEGERFYAARLPEGRQIEPRLLVVNGNLRSRARLPESGTFAHLSNFNVPWMSTTGGGWKRKPTHEELTTLKYKPGEVPASLDVKSAEITVYHMWDESCVGLAALDAQAQTLVFSSEAGHPAGAFGVRKFVLWNVREGLTQPGQWYHDRSSNRIVYWPLAGESMDNVQVLVPTVATILRLKGSSTRPIRNVSVRNVGFSITTTPLVAAGFAAARFDGCISLEQAENTRLEGLSIKQVAGHAINARGACTATRVEDCEIAECGAGGIYVGGTRAVITNNHVRGVGRFYPSAIGIFRGGRNNIVSHNEVHDCSYSAINYGGTENIIEDNLIYDCMKVLHDGAAIYMFAAKNCILRRNLARDFADTGGYGASAYYLDERSEGCVVERNLAVNVNWPSHNHMAHGNTIRNNVFVIKGDAKLTFPRSTNHVLEGNVIYATGKIRIENIDGVSGWSKNLLYSGAGKIEGVTLKDYSAKETVEGVRGDTTVGDPLFVDRAREDWRYKPESPALKLGLEPIDVSKAGRVRRP